MSEFEFPTNIKQIGSIGDGIRIYIEDYACSYLQQYAEAGGYEEKLAFLVGRYMIIDGQTVLFISGMVQGLYATVDKDMIAFSEKSWQHAKDEIGRYFKGLDIVGWMQSQPGYGIYLNASYANAHKKTFTREDQVMYVIDPIEKLNAFYIYDEHQNNLVESQGYFIYYDKNRGMHEYMLDNKIVKTKVRPLPEIEESAEPVVKEKTHAAKEPASHKRNERARKGTVNQKRVVNLLVSLSAVLFIVCFMMGAQMIQSDGRMSTLEDQLTLLNTAYRDLLVQLKTEKTASVFASQNEPISDENTLPSEQAVVITEDGNNVLIDQAVAQTDIGAAATADQPPSPETPPPSPLPANSSEPVSLNSVPETYTVQAGDSLSSISLKFYGSSKMIDEIMSLNAMDDADKIYFGKVLKLPKTQ